MADELTAGGGEALRFRTDDAPDEAVVTLDAFLANQSDASAVRLEAGEDARKLIPHLGGIALIVVDFPRFRDGRGYSAGRILREAGYTGELRAAGDVLVDQIDFMRRCGFDSFAPDAPVDPATMKASIERYAYHYQSDAIGSVPVWKLRHG